MNIVTGKFRNSRGDHYGFNYYFETVLDADEGVIIPMPGVTPNKRSVNDIGIMVDNDEAMIYGSLSPDAEVNDGADALWQELCLTGDINKVISAIKVENPTENPCRVAIRVIMC